MSQNSWHIETIRKLHESFASKRRIENLSDRISQVFPDAHSLLDVGCGNGRLARELLVKRKNLRIQGIDVKSTACVAIPYLQFDGQHIPFGDATWDVTMAIDVLHHCSEPALVLRELCRVSRRYVIIKDHIAENWLDFQILKFMDWVGNRGYGTQLPYAYFSSKEWSDVFVSCDLTQIVSNTDLEIYPLLVRWVFDRKLHFLSVLKKNDP